jgi:hypothetical protein
MRQARIDLSTPIEQKLREALRAIEEGPADVRMTKASMLVSEALEQVGDYVDEQLRNVEKGQ